MPFGSPPPPSQEGVSPAATPPGPPPFNPPPMTGATPPPPPPPPPGLPTPPDPRQPIFIPIDQAPVMVITPMKAGAIHHELGGHLLTAKEKPVYPVKAMSFAEAWTGDHRDDDLFACMYGTLMEPQKGHQGLYGAHDGEKVYRLTKDAPALFEAMGRLRKDQFVMTQFIIDIDLKDMIAVAKDIVPGQKVSWNDQIRDTFIDEVWTPAAQKMGLKQPTLFYTTRNGLRLVYLLSRPIPIYGPGGGLDRYRGLLLDLIQAGIQIDTQTKDWTRLQRLPKVRREIPDPQNPDKILQYEFTGEAEYLRMAWGQIDIHAMEDDAPATLIGYHPEAFEGMLSRGDLTQFQDSKHFESIRRVWMGEASSDLNGARYEHIECGKMPSDEEADALLYRPAPNGRKPLTSVAANVQRSLNKKVKLDSTHPTVSAVASNLVRVLFEGAQLDALETGNLHGSMMRGISDFCWMFNDQMGSTSNLINPQLIYALLLEPAKAMNERRANAEDQGKARSEDEIRVELWNLVTHVYPRAVNRFRQDEEDKARAEEEQNLVDTRKAELIQQYWIDRGWDADEVRSQWINWLIMSTQIGYCVMSIIDGTVTWSPPVQKNAEWFYFAAPERCGHDFIQLWMDTKDGRAVRPYVDILADYSCTSIATPRCSRVIAYNDIELYQESGIKSPKFIYKLAGVTENLEPAFDPEIDQWMRAYGKTNPEQFLDQMATFLDLATPWPAIYKHGFPDEGKNLLTAGLRLLVSTKTLSDFTDSLGSFQDEHKDTWLLTVDEGASTENGSHQKVLSEVFRRNVGGDEVRVMQKGIKGLRVEGCVRILVSANHEEAMDWGTNLTALDIEALRKRVAFYGPSPEARDILHRAGGRLGNKHGPGTEKTQWPLRIAKHVLYLNQNRDVQSSGRFAVDVTEDSWHQRQRAKGSGQSVICRAIAKMITASGNVDAAALMVVPETSNNRTMGIYVNAEAFYEQMQIVFANDRQEKTPNLSRTAKILKGLSLEQVRFRPENTRRRLRGIRLDINAVVSILDAEDLDCDFSEYLGDIWTHDVSVGMRSKIERGMTVIEGARQPIPFPNKAQA